MVEALGGKAALSKIHNRVAKGKFEMVGLGSKAKLTICSAAPNKTHVKLVGEGSSKHERGSDGTTYWEVNPTRGARVMEGPEKVFWRRHSVFNPELHWRELYDEVECVAVEDVEGKSCYKVVLTPAEGEPDTWYIDRNTHLPVKLVVVYPLPAGETVEIVEFLTDYRRVDGVLLPHGAKSILRGQERRIVFVSIKQNVDIPADEFDLPDAIKKLEEEAAKPEPAPTH
jgi:hypothetical protein